MRELGTIRGQEADVGEGIPVHHDQVGMRARAHAAEFVLHHQDLGTHRCRLALEHAIAGATGIRGLVLMSGPASIEEWTAETLRLRDELPASVRETLLREVEQGRVGSPAFKEAYAVWERTHVLRMDDPPPWEADGLALFEQDMRVYELTTGGVEFPTQGTTFELAGWDIRPHLGKVNAPTLLLSGRYDEATPAVMGTLHRGIKASQWHLLQESSHSCHTEEEALTMLLVADFLARIEGEAG